VARSASRRQDQNILWVLVLFRAPVFGVCLIDKCLSHTHPSLLSLSLLSLNRQNQMSINFLCFVNANKTFNAKIIFFQPFICALCVCVYVCVRERVCVCVYTCVRVCVCEWVCVYIYIYIYIYIYMCMYVCACVRDTVNFKREIITAQRLYRKGQYNYLHNVLWNVQ